MNKGQKVKGKKNKAINGTIVGRFGEMALVEFPNKERKPFFVDELELDEPIKTNNGKRGDGNKGKGKGNQ